MHTPDPNATDSHTPGPGPRSFLVQHRLAIALLLFLVSAGPRFYDLDRNSFFGDEAFTVLSARSVLDGEGAAMPAGMSYNRSLPLTYANAAAAAIMGRDREASYRVTSALFGSLTAPALFLTGTAFVSPPAALVGGTLLSVSEWHVARSRVGRMYPPFAFFFLLTGVFFWKWTRDGRNRDLVLAVVLFGSALSLQLLGLFAVLLALIPLGFRRPVKPPAFLVLLVGFGLALLGYLVDDALVRGAYRPWGLPGDYVLAGLPERTGEAAAAAGLPALALVALALAGGIGVWFAWRLVRAPGEAPGEVYPFHMAALLGSGLFAGLFVAQGQLWGAALAGSVVLLLQPFSISEALRRSWLPAGLLALGGAAWALFSVGTMGVSAGVRAISEYPFPYLAFFWFQFPGLVLLFLAGILWLILSPTRRGDAGLVALALFVILNMTAVGMLREWGSTRYLFHAYPFLLLFSGAVLVHGTTWLAHRFAPLREAPIGLGLALAVVLGGVTGGHGIAHAVTQATVRAGEPVNEYTIDIPYLPDHRGAGQFLRESLREGDLVIAEEQRTLYVYLGQADYWFRRAGDARNYLYLAPDGVPRDYYVNSALISTVEGVEEVLATARGRVWFVTSGETAWLRSWYLSPQQADWLEGVEGAVSPSFVGADRATNVYCLNC